MLKINPRLPDRNSIIEAEMDATHAEEIVYDVESETWEALAPSGDVGRPIAFIDGVQNLDIGVVDDEIGERPVGGIMASYAAGAMCIGGDPQLRHVIVKRAIIMGEGREHAGVTMRVGKHELFYRPFSCSGNDPMAFTQRLNDLRGRLEMDVIAALGHDGGTTIITDGRLPPIGPSRVIGLIKTPHILPFANYADQFRLLPQLKTGERTPILKRRRSAREFYSWFVCLRAAGPHDFSLSGVVMLEMDTSNSIAQVRAAADFTACALPRFASDPMRDPRAPQNLLPVGELERQLRRRLGDPAVVQRAIRRELMGVALGNG
jgi:hypothetical protein